MDQSLTKIPAFHSIRYVQHKNTLDISCNPSNIHSQPMDFINTTVLASKAAIPMPVISRGMHVTPMAKIGTLDSIVEVSNITLLPISVPHYHKADKTQTPNVIEIGGIGAFLISLANLLPTIPPSLVWSRASDFRLGLISFMKVSNVSDDEVKNAWVEFVQSEERIKTFAMVFESIPLKETNRLYLGQHTIGMDPSKRVRELVNYITGDINPLLVRLRTYITKGVQRSMDSRSTEYGIVIKVLTDLQSSSSATTETLLELLETYLIPIFCTGSMYDDLIAKCGGSCDHVRESSVVSLCTTIIMEVMLTLSQHGGAHPIASFLLQRWEEKNVFNRSDAREEDIRLVNEEREEIKRKKIEFLESISEDNKEFIKEYRDIRIGVSWDDIARDFAPGDTSQVEEVAMALDKRSGTEVLFDEGEEDARAMYWNAEEEGEGISDTFYN